MTSPLPPAGMLTLVADRAGRLAADYLVLDRRTIEAALLGIRDDLTSVIKALASSEPKPVHGRYSVTQQDSVNFVCNEDGTCVAFFGGREVHDKWHAAIGDHLARFDGAGQMIQREAGEVRDV